MADSTDVIQGTLDMLILKSLSLEPMHGFGVTKRIEQISRAALDVRPPKGPTREPRHGLGVTKRIDQISGGVFRVNPGSLLLAFQRMERQGLMGGEWRVRKNNRRPKYYRLTAKGRKRLDA